MALGSSRLSATSRWKRLFDRLDERGEVANAQHHPAGRRARLDRSDREGARASSSIPEVQIKLLQKSVGGITEADVTLADASDAIIIGFNVVPDEKARMHGR